MAVMESTVPPTVVLRIPGCPLRTYHGACEPGRAGLETALADFILEQYGMSPSLYWLDMAPGRTMASVRLRLRGGKGGFGSNLRAQGSKMASKRRQGTREACRDLAGRRISTLNQAKLISDYLARKPELERRREQQIREKMVKTIERAERRPIFEDVDYLRTARETLNTVESAVLEALLSGEEEEGGGKDNVAKGAASGSNGGGRRRVSKGLAASRGTPVDGDDKGKEKCDPVVG